MSGTQTTPVPVTVFSRGVVSAAVLVKYERLDRDAKTASVVGAKATIPGRRVGNALLVRLGSGRLVPATLTHIHARHDRYRAAIASSYLTDEVVVDTREFGSIVAGRVSVFDPLTGQTDTVATEAVK